MTNKRENIIITAINDEYEIKQYVTWKERTFKRGFLMAQVAHRIASLVLLAKRIHSDIMTTWNEKKRFLLLDL